MPRIFGDSGVLPRFRRICFDFALTVSWHEMHALFAELVTALPDEVTVSREHRKTPHSPELCTFPRLVFYLLCFQHLVVFSVNEREHNAYLILMNHVSDFFDRHFVEGLKRESHFFAPILSSVFPQINFCLSLSLLKCPLDICYCPHFIMIDQSFCEPP